MATFPEYEKINQVINAFLQNLFEEFDIKLIKTEPVRQPASLETVVQISAMMNFKGWEFSELDNSNFEDFKNTLRLVRDAKEEANLIRENPSLKKAYNNYQSVKKLVKG